MTIKHAIFCGREESKNNKVSFECEDSDFLRVLWRIENNEAEVSFEELIELLRFLERAPELTKEKTDDDSVIIFMRMQNPDVHPWITYHVSLEGSKKEFRLNNNEKNGLIKNIKSVLGL